MGEDYIEHKVISARKLGAPEVAVDDASLETESRQMARSSSSADALAWLQKQAASPGRDLGLVSLAGQWAERDPSAAMAWVDSEAAQPVRPLARLRVFNRWADLDLTAANRWLAAHAPDAALDELLWYQATDTTVSSARRIASNVRIAPSAEPSGCMTCTSAALMRWFRRSNLRLLRLPFLASGIREDIPMRGASAPQRQSTLRAREVILSSRASAHASSAPGLWGLVRQAAAWRTPG